MPPNNNIKNDLQVMKRKLGTLTKELQKSPAISKELSKTFREALESIVSLCNSIESGKVDVER